MFAISVLRVKDIILRYSTEYFFSNCSPFIYEFIQFWISTLNSFFNLHSIRSKLQIRYVLIDKYWLSISTYIIYGLLYNFTEILLQFYISAASNSSWFSIGSFSNFQAGGIVDPRAMNRAPRVNAFVKSSITHVDIYNNIQTQNRNLLIIHHRILGPFSFISWQTKRKGYPFLFTLNTFC